MSLAIVIGSEPEHITNIQDTVSILKFTRTLVSDGAITLPNVYMNDSPAEFNSEYVSKIIDWYTGIYTLLTDPSALMDNSERELSFDEAVKYLISNEAEEEISKIQNRALDNIVLVINQYLLSIESIAPPFTSLTDAERAKLIALGTDGFCETMSKMMRMAMVITQESGRSL